MLDNKEQIDNKEQKESKFSTRRTQINSIFINKLPKSNNANLQSDNNNLLSKEENNNITIAFQALDEFIKAEEKFVNDFSDFIKEDVQTIIESFLDILEAPRYKKLFNILKNFVVYNNIFFMLLGDARDEKKEFKATSYENFSTRISMIHSVVCKSNSFTNMVLKIKPITDLQGESNAYISEVLKKKLGTLTFEQVLNNKEKNSISPNNIVDTLLSKKSKIEIEWEEFKKNYPLLCNSTIVSHITNIFMVGVQRIQKYKITLSEILKNIPNSRKNDKDLLNQVIETIHNNVANLNNSHQRKKRRDKLFAKSDTDIFNDNTKKVFNDQLLIEIANCLILYSAVYHPALISQQLTELKINANNLTKDQHEFLHNHASKLIEIYLKSPHSAFEQIKKFLTTLVHQQFPSDISKLSSIICTRLNKSEDKEEKGTPEEKIFFNDAANAEEFIQNIIIQLISEKFNDLLTQSQSPFSIGSIKFPFHNPTFSLRFNSLDELVIGSIKLLLLKISRMSFEVRKKNFHDYAEQPNLASYILYMINRELQPLGNSLPISRALLTEISFILSNVFCVNQSDVYQELQVYNFKKLNFLSTKKEELKINPTYAGYYNICRFLNLVFETPLGVMSAKTNEVPLSTIKTLRQTLNITPNLNEQLTKEIFLSFLLSHKKKQYHDTFQNFVSTLAPQLKNVILALFNNKKSNLQELGIQIPAYLFECELNEDQIHNYIQLNILQKTYEFFKEPIERFSTSFFLAANKNNLCIVYNLSLIINSLYQLDFADRQEYLHSYSNKGIKNIRELLIHEINQVLNKYKTNKTSILSESIQENLDKAIGFLMDINVKVHVKQNTGMEINGQSNNNIAKI